MPVYRNALGITPSDTVNLPSPTQAISVGVAGTVTVDMAGGQKNQLLTLPAGMFTIQVTKIYATGTTATGIAAYWL